MGRTHAPAQTHVGNYVALDPAVPQAGWKNEISQLTQGIWAQYQRAPKTIFAQARQAYLWITEGNPGQRSSNSCV